MWTIANARLVRAGPNCSPKTRFSPGATGVWSSALALIAIAFQRRTESARGGGLLGSGQGCRAWKSGPHASLTPSENPRLEVVEVRLEVSCAVAGCSVSHRKVLTTASRSPVFNPLLIVQLLVVGRNCFRNYFRNQFRNHFSALHPTFESGNHTISHAEIHVKGGPDGGMSTETNPDWTVSYRRNFLKSTGRFSTNAFRPSIASSVW